MSLNDMNGKAVKAVMFPGSLESCHGTNNTMTFESSYHGDRDEHWIVKRTAEGKEIARYNARLAESITWAE